MHSRDVLNMLMHGRVLTPVGRPIFYRRASTRRQYRIFAPDWNCGAPAKNQSPQAEQEATPFPPRLARARARARLFRVHCIRARLLEMRICIYNFGVPILELCIRHCLCLGEKISGSLNTKLNFSSFFSSKHPDLECHLLSPDSFNLILFIKYHVFKKKEYCI